MTAIEQLAKLADSMGTTLNITGSNEYHVFLTNCDVMKTSTVVLSEFGIGFTPERACVDYMKKIAGKKIVLHGTDAKERKEFLVLVPSLVSDDVIENGKD